MNHRAHGSTKPQVRHRVRQCAPAGSEYPTPKLSICIPTYNRCRYLNNALTHLFDEQRFPFESEVVVSDNASTDETQDVVESLAQSHRQLRYIRQTQNVGGLANIVAAERQARGEYTLYLADDDVLFPKEVGGVIEYLDRHPNVGVCFCAADMWDDVEKVVVGQHYDSGPEIVFSRDTAVSLCNFIVERHIFPEVFVCRSDFLHKLLYAVPLNAYWAFVNMINALRYADVAFLPTMYYRSISQHWEGERREQTGVTQTMTDWDVYRGGVEYMLLRAFTYAGFAGVPPEHQVAAQQMVQDFVNTRMRVALRLLIQFRGYLSAYEVLVRLQANARVSEAALAEYRGFLIGRAALDAFIRTFHAVTGARVLGLFRVDAPQNVGALIDEIEPNIPVEVLDHVDVSPIVDKDRYFVLCGGAHHRQALIDAGFPSGQVWSEADLIREFLI
jgi:glycosyltransferase involved in cell wall biosynthesis